MILGASTSILLLIQILVKPGLQQIVVEPNYLMKLILRYTGLLFCICVIFCNIAPQIRSKTCWMRSPVKMSRFLLYIFRAVLASIGARQPQKLALSNPFATEHHMAISEASFTKSNSK